jgi:hypothetical protein
MQPTSSLIVLPVCNQDIRSDFAGHAELAQFYDTAKQYNGVSIHLSFKRANWFDANMASFFSSILYRLHLENGLNFTADYKEIYTKFEVLFRNGFLKINGDTNDLIDTRLTTLPYKQFNKDDKDGFIYYIDQSLMKHKGMLPIDKKLQEQIKFDLIELMTNVNYHSNTDDPFFVCGHFYPKLSCLKLTLTDIGEGFLPKIHTITNGVITTDIEAITWALSGKTTKPLDGNKVPGGIGIKSIYNYCTKHKAAFSIATGKAFWSTELIKTVQGPFRLLPCSITGSTINLHFYTK